MKLELKHIAPYLPYGLNVNWNYEYSIGTLIGISYLGNRLHYQLDFNGVNGLYEDIDFKPILRPLSDLTKEIEHNGEKFEPMKVLFDMLNPFVKYSEFSTFNYYYQGFAYDKNGKNVGWVEVVPEDRIFHTTNGRGVKTLMYNQIDAWQKLFEWHFDVFGLIDKKLAIDINILNPKEGE